MQLENKTCKQQPGHILVSSAATRRHGFRSVPTCTGTFKAGATAFNLHQAVYNGCRRVSQALNAFWGFSAFQLAQLAFKTSSMSFPGLNTFQLVPGAFNTGFKLARPHRSSRSRGGRWETRGTWTECYRPQCRSRKMTPTSEISVSYRRFERGNLPGALNTRGFYRYQFAPSAINAGWVSMHFKIHQAHLSSVSMRYQYFHAALSTRLSTRVISERFNWRQALSILPVFNTAFIPGANLPYRVN